MLFENVMAILKKCELEGIHDVLDAEEMIATEKIDVLAEIREAGKFLRKYYKEITKCNRLGMSEKIKELCEAKEDKNKLASVLLHIERIEE